MTVLGVLADVPVGVTGTHLPGEVLCTGCAHKRADRLAELDELDTIDEDPRAMGHLLIDAVLGDEQQRTNAMGMIGHRLAQRLTPEQLAEMECSHGHKGTCPHGCFGN